MANGVDEGRMNRQFWQGVYEGMDQALSWRMLAVIAIVCLGIVTGYW